MAESRIEKYKEYRNSILSESAPSLQTPKYSKGNKKEEDGSIKITSTLPMDEVMQALGNEDQEVVFLRKHHRRKVVFITVAAILGVILVAAIVVVGILLWR